jgi:hypothetical protein
MSRIPLRRRSALHVLRRCRWEMIMPIAFHFFASRLVSSHVSLMRPDETNIGND